MTDFILIDPENTVFKRLTREFHEFMEYLNEIDQSDLSLCTIVLDECVNYISIIYNEDKLAVHKTIQYIEDTISKAHKSDEIKVTIFEGLYSQHYDILENLKGSFKKETKALFDEWFATDRKILFFDEG